MTCLGQRSTPQEHGVAWAPGRACRGGAAARTGPQSCSRTPCGRLSASAAEPRGRPRGRMGRHVLHVPHELSSTSACGQPPPVPTASLTDMGATPQEMHRHGGGAGECGWEGDHRAALPSAGGYGGTAPTWQCRERSPSLRKQGEVVFVGGRDRETRGLSAGPPRAGRLAGPLGLGRKPPREGGSTRGSGAARMKVAGSPGTGGRPA